MLFYDQTPHQIEDKVYLVKLTMKLMLLGNAVKFKQLCLQNVTSILCLINKVFFRVFGECYIFSKRRNLILKVVVIEKRPKKTKGQLWNNNQNSHIGNYQHSNSVYKGVNQSNWLAIGGSSS